MPRLTSKTPAAPKKQKTPKREPTAKETLRTGSEGEPTFQTPKERSEHSNGAETQPSAMYLTAIVTRLDTLDRKLGMLSQEIASLHAALAKPGEAPAPKVEQTLPGVAPSLDTLKDRVTHLLTAGQRQKVIDALTSLGVKKATDLPEADRQRFLDLLN